MVNAIANQERFVKCFFCGREFKPTSHNRVHIGGQGEVYGCDECLDLAPPVPDIFDRIAMEQSA